VCQLMLSFPIASFRVKTAIWNDGPRVTSSAYYKEVDK
jgi:hypothetical protein